MTDVMQETSLGESLRKEVQTLHELRLAEATIAARIKAAKEAFDLSVQADTQALAATKRAIEAADGAVRGLAMVRAETEGVTKAFGVEVVKAKEYEIDEEAGLAWARTTRMCLVPEKLDTAAVKKMAAVTALPFVVVHERPAVRIASDLGKALEVAA